jgi:hypothetical protein
MVEAGRFRGAKFWPEEAGGAEGESAWRNGNGIDAMYSVACRLPVVDVSLAELASRLSTAGYQATSLANQARHPAAQLGRRAVKN